MIKPGDIITVKVSEPPPFDVHEILARGNPTQMEENNGALRMFAMYLDADMMMCPRKWFEGVAQILNERLAKIEALEKELATLKLSL